MLASVHIADLDLRAALKLVRTRKSKLTTPGLRHANLGLTALLGAGLPPKPDLHRVALVAMWDDDTALDGFLERSPVATAFADGWSTRLQPLRARTVRGPASPTTSRSRAPRTNRDRSRC